ncbi:MAG: tRNA (adenosine(37)-N6)-threonylcarbamoyltransferase complex transferase subunit TsaD [Candidatus Aminicenantaceae bacterium]
MVQAMNEIHILGVETSCDETAAAVIGHDSKILSSVVLSQDKIHAPFGGVVPELASRQHIMSIGYVVEEAMRRAGLCLEEISCFAVTQGPGLIGSLLVGISFMKSLAYYFKKPLISIDHLEAHIQSAFINNNIPFPALALVVSGGHTSIFIMKKKLSYNLIGKTKDDAAGEALDKIAKFLDLGYPGGPVIERLAEKGNPDRFEFSIPYMRDKSLDYSFSGLKTAALQEIKKLHIKKDESSKFYDFIASFEKGVMQALYSNLIKAIEITKPESLILCGGVARNKKLRKGFREIAEEEDLGCFIPSPEFCTDNAVMVAFLALEKYKTNKIKSFPLDLNAYSRRR